MQHLTRQQHRFHPCSVSRICRRIISYVNPTWCTEPHLLYTPNPSHGTDCQAILALAVARPPALCNDSSEGLVATFAASIGLRQVVGTAGSGKQLSSKMIKMSRLCVDVYSIPTNFHKGGAIVWQKSVFHKTRITQSLSASRTT